MLLIPYSHRVSERRNHMKKKKKKRSGSSRLTVGVLERTMAMTSWISWDRGDRRCPRHTCAPSSSDWGIFRCPRSRAVSPGGSSALRGTAETGAEPEREPEPEIEAEEPLGPVVSTDVWELEYSPRCWERGTEPSPRHRHPYSRSYVYRNIFKTHTHTHAQTTYPRLLK